VLSNLVLELQGRLGQAAFSKQACEDNGAGLKRYFNHELIYKPKQNRLGFCLRLLEDVNSVLKLVLSLLS
jgi:hypothetical protein